MNIFAVDPDPNAAARCLVDKHVVKMPLETAQIVSTVFRESVRLPTFDSLYQPTHTSHPVTEWAGAWPSNLAWTVQHGLALGAEYDRRFGGEHKSVTDVLKPVAEYLTDQGWRDYSDHEPFAQAMPDEYKRRDNAVLAYRDYYRAEKVPEMGEWTNRDAPSWVAPEVDV